MVIFLNHFTLKCGRISFHTSQNLKPLIPFLQSTYQSFHQSNIPMDIFKGIPDRFRGILVKNPEEFPNDIEDFRQKLENSLKKWKENGLQAVWFFISLNNAKYIPILSENKFIYHRVNDPSGQTLVMYRWLPNSVSHVPPYAHTMVGSGAIVINDENQLLVVHQEYGSLKIWKLPGGYVEPNEEIDEASVREVEEETGVKTRFRSTVLFRHSHHANFDCSDLYYISVLEPLSKTISDDSHEVLAVKWMAVDEFLNHPEIHELNKKFIRIYLDQKENNIEVVKETGLHPVNKKPYSMYYWRKK